ncbi:MAG TPA: serine/threonine-protein kinase [Polyangiaceae bacterium]|jgi:serine/threonine protein kinase|nr:serine/threonine-protein kinase [Polyangiaceae bacterium]
MPLGAGSVVGNVRLERELGKGAMGTVWQARHQALGSDVAVKVLQRGAHHSDAHARFAHEARGVASLDSPHVVRIFDYGMTPEGEPYLVMELLRGSDLRQHVANHGALDLRAAAVIVRQLCTALGSAHERGIIHRDIKPANVFLISSGGEPFVKLVDFGIAKQVYGEMHMTSTGALLGTPYYMSPEQFADPRTIDHRSDLWSVAVLAYECVTGRRPFAGQTPSALCIAAHERAYAAPSSVRPGLPAALDAWFDRALQPKPEHRFQSAMELAQTFEQAVGMLNTLSAPGVPAVTQWQPPERRSAVPWIIGALGVVVLLAAAFFGREYLLHGEDRRAEQPHKPKSAERAPPPAPDPVPDSPPPPPPTTPPTPKAVTEAPKSVAPVSAPASKLRGSGTICRKSDANKSCVPCCGGDREYVLAPYPRCECMFDGEKWDREHGKLP